MTTVPSIANTDRVLDSTPISATTDFEITFPVIADTEAAAVDDLVVIVAGMIQDPSTYTFSGTVISGLTNMWNGGTVTLDSATAARVIIYSKRDPRRVGYFLEGKSLPLTELDRLMDDFALQMRDVAFTAKSALKFDVADIIDGTDTAVPSKSARAGRVAAFGAEGDGAPLVPSNLTLEEFEASGTAANEAEASAAAAAASATAAAASATSAAGSAAAMIDVANEVTKTDSFSITTSDIGKLFVVVLGAASWGGSNAKTCTLPATTGIVGQMIAVRMSVLSQNQLKFRPTSGQPTSSVIGWPDNQLYMLPGELLHLRAGTGGWEIIGGISKPIKGLFMRSGALGDIALIANTQTGITFDTALLGTGTVGGQFGNGWFAMNPASGSQVQPLRRGLYTIKAWVRITTAASPTVFQLSPSGGGNIYTSVVAVGGIGALQLYAEGRAQLDWGSQNPIFAYSGGANATVSTASGFEPRVSIEEDAPW